MLSRRGVFATLVAFLAMMAGAASGDTGSTWGQPTVGGFVFDASAANTQAHELYIGQAGTATDRGSTVAFAEPNGNTYHILGYTRLDLTAYGVPTAARYAIFGVKAVITKGDTAGVADVFAFMRAPGSTCCQGLPAAPDYPLDFGFGQTVEGMAQQAVADVPHDGARSFTQVTEPLVNGAVEFSWGYTKVDGQWPAGDAVAIDLYLVGYAT